MRPFPFQILFGAPTKLDFVLPELCSNCGTPGVVALREVHLYASYYGLRMMEYPGMVMDVPLCNLCQAKKIARPVTLEGVKLRFLGRAKQATLRFRNHEFAKAFKAANSGLIASGWIKVIDRGRGV